MWVELGGLHASCFEDLHVGVAFFQQCFFSVRLLRTALLQQVARGESGKESACSCKSPLEKKASSWVSAVA